jgi:SOS response regulatory protein OraA/RecX
MGAVQPKGARRCGRNCGRKGVDRAVIDTVLEESDMPRIRRPFRRPWLGPIGIGSPGRSSRRNWAYLARRGFDETVREAVQAAWQVVHADEPSTILTN